MEELIGVICIGAGLILLLVYFAQNAKKTNTNKKNNTKQTNKTTVVDMKNLKDNITKSVSNKASTTVENRSKYSKNSKADIAKKDLFDFMEFEKIQDDMIIQDKGTKFTMVLQCKGINYDLMSEVEQLAVEEGFITFLNTLTTPIQLYVQARAIDLKTSLNMYKDRVAEFNKEYEETADRYNKLSNSMNTTERELAEAQMEKEKMFNISEYAHDITRYVERLSLNKHMLQRKFYVVISYYKSEVNTTAKFSEQELFDICYRELYTRAQGVVSALQSCSVSARVLDSNELAELIYITYNRDDQKLLDIRTALESGFYRMYSTTKDIHDKKNELLKKQIKEEAMNRLETAIKLAIQEGRVIDEDQKIEDFEEDVDKTAILMADEVDMPEELRDTVQDIILDGHRKGVNERKKAKAEKEAKKQQEEMSKIEITEEELKQMNNDNAEEKTSENIDLPSEEKNEDTKSVMSDDSDDIIITDKDENEQITSNNDEKSSEVENAEENNSSENDSIV